MNIDITSLICSILTVTVSVTFAVTFKISLNKKITEINKTVNDFKTEANHKFKLIERRLTRLTKKNRK